MPIDPKDIRAREAEEQAAELIRAWSTDPYGMAILRWLWRVSQAEAYGARGAGNPHWTIADEKMFQLLGKTEPPKERN